MFTARFVWLSCLASLALVAAATFVHQDTFAQEAKPKPAAAAADPFAPATPKSKDGERRPPAAADPFAPKPPAGFDGNLSLIIGSGQTVHEQKSKTEIALQQNATFDFVETPIKDAFSFLQEAHGVPFVLNDKKLEEANISPDLPITVHLNDVKLETALDLLTRKLGITYDVTDELIEVTTLKDLQARPHVRLYDCRDLLALRPDGTPAKNPEGIELVQPAAPGDAESLMQTITRTVDAQSWHTQSGSGTIENFKGMLIVSHTSLAHRQIEKLLNTIRETAGLEPRAGKPVR